MFLLSWCINKKPNAVEQWVVKGEVEKNYFYKIKGVKNYSISRFCYCLPFFWGRII
jgi:hypothetical protein